MSKNKGHNYNNCLVQAWKEKEHRELKAQLDAIYEHVLHADACWDNAVTQLNTYNRDEKIQELLTEIETLKKRGYGVFSITPEEQELIKVWKNQHIQEDHHGDSYAGAIGGNWTYQFTPTSIGVIGEIKCSCGKKFTFRDLD